jgi:hypothetical protein
LNPISKKFRTLSLNELQSLEKEFVLYLSTNGIDAKKWEEIKSNFPSKSSELIENFSTMIWQNIFQNKAYMVLEEGKNKYYFHFKINEYDVIRLTLSNFDSQLEIGRKTNMYTSGREEEMYHYMLNGAYFIDQNVFNEINAL